MSIQIDTSLQAKERLAVVKISGEMTIYNAAEIKQKLFGHFNNIAKVQLDLGAVEELVCSCCCY